MRTFPTTNISARHAKACLEDGWIPIFGVPEAILTDRGTVFKANEFKTYINSDLKSYHIFTSPYYPQGNAINEASHSGLENSIRAALAANEINFETALRDATAVHNACPHVATLKSPHAALFGVEPTFAAWQRWGYMTSEEDRSGKLTENRRNQLLRTKLEEEKTTITAPTI